MGVCVSRVKIMQRFAVAAGLALVMCAVASASPTPAGAVTFGANVGALFPPD
jgi:hypothetical protein